MDRFELTEDGVMDQEKGDVISSSSRDNPNWNEYQDWYSQGRGIPFIEKCRHKLSYAFGGNTSDLYSKKAYAESRDAEFMKNDLKTGVLSSSDLQILLDSIENAPLMPRLASDHIPGYYFDKNFSILESGWAEHFRYFDLRGETESIQKVFSNLAPKIRACFGYDFRLVNFNCWGMQPSSAGFGANVWHTDGFPPGIYKVLIYLTPPGKERGTSEVLLPDGSKTMVEGPAGTWILFNATTLYHRGVPAVSGERIIMNVTVVPAFKGAVRPVFAGLNANFPWFPWS